MNKVMAKLALGLIVLSCVQSNAANRVYGISQYPAEHPNAIGVINYMNSPSAQGELEEINDNTRDMSILLKRGMKIKLTYEEKHDYIADRGGFKRRFFSAGEVTVELDLLGTQVVDGKSALSVSDSELIYEIYGADHNKSLDVLGRYKYIGNCTIACESSKKCTVLSDF